MPVFSKPEAIFAGVNAFCQAGQKTLQKALFDMETIARLFIINSLRPLV